MVFGRYSDVLVFAAAMCAASSLWAQTSVTYGKITAVKPVTVENNQAQTGGALVGGALGLVLGRGQSSSNRVLRTVGGAVAGLLLVAVYATLVHLLRREALQRS